jgi:hypothetical protein
LGASALPVLWSRTRFDGLLRILYLMRSGAAVLPSLQRPGGHTALRQLEHDKAWSRTMYVRIEKPCRSMQTCMGACMYRSNKSAWIHRTQVANENREDQPGPIRLFVDRTRVPNCLRQYNTVQVQYIPAFRGGSCACMYCCTVSDGSVRSRLHATSSRVWVGTKKAERGLRRPKN